MTKQEKNIINKAIKDSLKELILKYDKVIIQQKYKDSVKCRYKIGNLDDTNFLVENHLNDEIDIFEISYIYDFIIFYC